MANPRAMQRKMIRMRPIRSRRKQWQTVCFVWDQPNRQATTLQRRNSWSTTLNRHSQKVKTCPEPIDFKALEPVLKTKNLPTIDEKTGITQAHVDDIKAENDLACAMHQSKVLSWTKREQQCIDNLSTACATTWSCCKQFWEINFAVSNAQN